MRFEYIILLIVAFNVVTALAQRRAKKKRAEQARRMGGGASPDAASPEGSFEDDDEEGRDFRSARTERAPREAERMPSLGRDILDQIARDLGLKVPRPSPPERPERPSEPARAERPAPVILAERPTPLPESSEARATEDRRREQAYLIPSAPSRPSRAPSAARGSTTTEPRRSPAHGEAPASRKVPTAMPVARVDLRDPVRLREAFVWKEVLGEPASRRR